MLTIKIGLWKIILCGSEVDRTGSGSCPIDGSGKCLRSAIKVLRVRNMATVRTFEVMSWEFKVLRICTREN
jgi:hypothetical protein